MTQNKTDIYGSLVLNIDQSHFKKIVMDLIEQYSAKHQSEVIKTPSGSTRGYKITDYVLTINASTDKRNCEVYRNRDGKLVFAMYDGKNASINWEYIFIQSHIEQLLEKGK